MHPAPAKTFLSPRLFTVQILVAVCHTECANVEGSNSLGALYAPSLWDRNTPLPMGYHAEFGRSWSNCTNIRMEIYWKNWAFRVQLFNVTQGHRKRHGSISQTNSDIGPLVKNVNFSYQLYLTPQLRKLTSKFCNGVWAQKPDDVPTRRRKK